MLRVEAARTSALPEAVEFVLDIAHSAVIILRLSLPVIHLRLRGRLQRLCLSQRLCHNNTIGDL